VALIVTIAIALALAACTDAPGGLGASVAWDGHGYTAVWGWPETSRNQIVVSTLQTRRGDRPAPERTQVARVDALAAAPELVWNGTRFLLVLHHGSGAITAQPVAPAGRAGGPRWPLAQPPARPLARSALALCTTPVWLESSYGVAWAARTERGDVEYLLARVSQDGALLGLTTIDRGPSRAPGCALQASDHRFALSYVLDRPDDGPNDRPNDRPDDGPDDGLSADPDDSVEARLMFTRVDASGRITLRRQLAAPDGPVQPLRLRALGTGYALLYRARGPSPLHLVRLSGTGRQLGSLALPPGIRPDTVDIVAGPDRFAAAWTEPGRVHLVTLDGAGKLITGDELDRPGELARVRMAAQGDTCALTWTELGDRALVIATSPTCLAAGAAFSPLRVRLDTAAPSLGGP
jgi:hypothetical protein